MLHMDEIVSQTPLKDSGANKVGNGAGYQPRNYTNSKLVSQEVQSHAQTEATSCIIQRIKRGIGICGQEGQA
jgi:hypothetical protein